MQACVDYIWFNPKLVCTGIVEMLPPDELAKWKTLPSKYAL